MTNPEKQPNSTELLPVICLNGVMTGNAHFYNIRTNSLGVQVEKSFFFFFDTEPFVADQININQLNEGTTILSYSSSIQLWLNLFQTSVCFELIFLLWIRL